ncbi:hypothetical protein J7E81_15350 [Bacillus sp. ISL-18]|uniref:hypothetical protein n=1 Tax=Bacillus sp. ISL-18 TaxID=2819118 RepID=UPI001BEAC528|nr:hypothetical protein [Bacillus sp. ISL-18]MBT2656594.1 hypothetical protein [Bacillus sp. ISL-18]
MAFILGGIGGEIIKKFINKLINDFREYIVIKEKMSAKFWTIFAKIWFWLAILFTIVCVFESNWLRSQTSDYLISIVIMWAIYLFLKFSAKEDRKFAEEIEKEFNNENKD